MTSLNTNELVASTLGYVGTDSARRAVMGGADSRFSFSMKSAITGAVTDLAWQMGGRGFTYNIISKENTSGAKFGDSAPPAANFVSPVRNEDMMGRALYWTVFGWGLSRLQGGSLSFLDSAINGVVAPMVGDQLQKMMPKK